MVKLAERKAKSGPLKIEDGLPLDRLNRGTDGYFYDDAIAVVVSNNSELALLIKLSV